MNPFHGCHSFIFSLSVSKFLFVRCENDSFKITDANLSHLIGCDVGTDIFRNR